MIKIFSWVTKDTNFDFMKTKKVTFAVSTIMVLLSIICIAVKGFNFGIDFSGGILMEIKSPEVINVESLRNELNVLDIDDLNLQAIGEEGNEIVIRAQAKDLDEKAQMGIINKIKETLDKCRADYERGRISKKTLLDHMIAADAHLQKSYSTFSKTFLNLIQYYREKNAIGRCLKAIGLQSSASMRVAMHEEYIKIANLMSKESIFNSIEIAAHSSPNFAMEKKLLEGEHKVVQDRVVEEKKAKLAELKAVDKELFQVQILFRLEKIFFYIEEGYSYNIL